MFASELPPDIIPTINLGTLVHILNFEERP